MNRSPAHMCHFDSCQALTPKKLLFCKTHWDMVPKDVQDEVYDAYRWFKSGSREGKRNYVLAVGRAKACVREELQRRAERRIQKVFG